MTEPEAELSLRPTVSKYNRTLKSWIEGRSIEERRQYLKSDWDAAYELAHLSLKAAEIVALPIDKATEKKADRFAEKVDVLGRSHYQKTGHKRQHINDRVPTVIVPEPFNSLASSADMHCLAVAFAVRGSLMAENDRLNPEVTGPKLVQEFMDAVGDLIGPDVYIEGMNPYEDMPFISEAA
jgi:hypothetical protein